MAPRWRCWNWCKAVRSIALRIAYDGTDFVGSQWQNNGRSVQGELEGAWRQFAQEERRFTLAGRTDAGVHAQGQVAHIRSSTRHSLTTIRRGMNAVLPEDVSVLQAWEVGADFHARHSALRRAYRYLIDNNPAPWPLLRHHVVHLEQPLDVAAMHAALQCLQGRHDFAAFASVGAEQRSTVRTCHHAACHVIDYAGRPLIALELVANAFLHHMVRVIVGTVLQVGRGRIAIENMAAVLQSGDRRRAGPTAAAHGLTLMDVVYPPGMLEAAAAGEH